MSSTKKEPTTVETPAAVMQHNAGTQGATKIQMLARLVLGCVLVVSYFEYLRLPEWIAVNIDVSRSMLHGGIAPTQQHVTTTSTSTQWVDDPAAFTEATTDSVAELARFDDNAFVRQYTCNASHGYQIRILRRDPQLMYVANFLAPGEADHLRSIGLPGMDRSTVVGEERHVHEARTSHNAFLRKAQDAVVQCVEQRVAKFLQKPVENLEPLQVVWYRDGQEYRPHYDYFPQGAAGTEKELLRGGQRLATFFVYLNTVPERNGGHTTFPNLDLKVPAVKNDAAFWYDVTPDGKDDERTFHGGSPVYNAEKWGLNVWVRHEAFK